MAMIPHSIKIGRNGEFVDAAQESRFATSAYEQDLALARISVIAAMSACLLFAPLDILQLPAQKLPLFLGVRLVIAALSVATLHGLAPNRHSRHLTAITHAYFYAFFSLNALVFDHPALTRHGGMMFPLMALGFFMLLPGAFRSVAILSAYGPAISLLFWGVLRPNPEKPGDFGIVVAITLIAYGVGYAARAQLNLMRRTEFAHIEREQQDNVVLRDAKDEAEAGARAKADFLAVMSHEIRTPMNGILGLSRLLEQNALSPKDRERLSLLTGSAKALLKILDDILDFSKLEAGQLAFEQMPLRLDELLGDIHALLELEATGKGIGLVVDVAPDLPLSIMGDPGRLRQILLNLVGNAVKFTSRGEVKLLARALDVSPGQERALEFAVSDTGIGIPSSKFSQLFTPFSQADASIARRYGGAGLGLAICKRLVDSMGGEIGATSTPGQGSRFTVRLPLVAAAASVAADGAQQQQAAHLPPLRILLAEDNEVNRIIARDQLEQMGHSVTTVENGADAVEMAANGAFDIVLMDLQMPQVDGIEASRRIRALPSPAADTPILAMTANALVQDRDRCLTAGMDGHLAKPFSQFDLVMRISQAIARRRRQPHACDAPRAQGGSNIAALADILVIGSAPAQLQQTGSRIFPLRDHEAARQILLSRPFDLILDTTDNCGAREILRQVSGRRFLSCRIARRATIHLSPPPTACWRETWMPNI